jgi:hypothetical protein
MIPSGKVEIGERKQTADDGQRAELVKANKAVGDELAAAEVKLASNEVELGPALSLEA